MFYLMWWVTTKGGIGSVAKISWPQTTANCFFSPTVSDFKKPNIYQVMICPIPWIWVLFSFKIIRVTQLGRKTTRFFDFHWTIDIDCSPGQYDLRNGWKECCWTLKRLKNSLNWQDIGKFEEKKSWRGQVDEK